jgi:hypothetical protein
MEIYNITCHVGEILLALLLIFLLIFLLFPQPSSSLHFISLPYNSLHFTFPLFSILVLVNTALRRGEERGGEGSYDIQLLSTALNKTDPIR